MAIKDLKIISYGGRDVASLPDKLTGTAAQNKAAFDRLAKEVVVPAFNALVEELAGRGADRLIWSDGIRSLDYRNGAFWFSTDGQSFRPLSCEMVGADREGIACQLLTQHNEEPGAHRAEFGARARKSVMAEKVLQSMNWQYQGQDIGWLQPVEMENVEADSWLELAPDPRIRPNQMRQYQEALLVPVMAGKGVFYVDCMGQKPSLDLPVRVIHRGDLGHLAALEE